MASADVSADTLQERLTRVFEVLAAHYGAPEHLVQLQILLDLSHNPKTSAETRQAVAAHGEKLTRAWVPLFEGALGEAARETRPGALRVPDPSRLPAGRHHLGAHRRHRSTTRCRGGCSSKGSPRPSKRRPSGAESPIG